MRGSVGAGSLEYIGVLTVVAVAVAAFAVVPASFPFRDAIGQALCAMFSGGDCGASEELALPQCEISAEGREIGASITAFSIVLGRTDKYDLVQYGDGTARVMTGDVLEAGAAAEAGGGSQLSMGDDGSVSGGLSGEASLTGTGGLQLIYDFDDADEAEQWVEDNRNIFTQSLNFAGGPLADGAEQLWNHLDDDRPVPSAYAVEVGASLQLGGEGGIGGVASGAASGQLGVTGVLQQNRDGTSQFSTEAKASAEGELILAMANGELGGDYSAGYTVQYDSSGRPTRLELTTVTRWDSAVGMNTLGLASGGSTIDEFGWDFDIGKWGGETRTTTVLDLTDPANRAAFDDVFLTAGPFAVMDPQAPFDGSAGALQQRVSESGIVVSAAYAVDTSDSGIDIHGGGGLQFALDVGSDSFERRLLEANVYNGADPAAGFQPLSTC